MVLFLRLGCYQRKLFSSLLPEQTNHPVLVDFRAFSGSLCSLSLQRSQLLVLKPYLGISKSFNRGLVVYQGPLVNRIKSLKYLSLSTSLVSLVAQPVIILRANEVGSSLFAAGIASTLGTVVFLTPFLINLVTKRYVYQVEFDTDSQQFTAYTLNILNRPVKHLFKAGDMKMLPVDKIFANVCICGDKPLFIDLKQVTDYHALELMLDQSKSAS